MNRQTQGLSRLTVIPRTRTQLSWLPTQCPLHPTVLLLYLGGNLPWEALLLQSDSGIIATAFSDRAFFSSAARHREERDCTPSPWTRKTDALWGGVCESFHCLAPEHLQGACTCKRSLTFPLQTPSCGFPCKLHMLIIACGETFPQRLWFSHVALTSKTSPLLCFSSGKSSWEILLRRTFKNSKSR